MRRSLPGSALRAEMRKPNNGNGLRVAAIAVEYCARAIWPVNPPSAKKNG